MCLHNHSTNNLQGNTEHACNENFLNQNFTLLHGDNITQPESYKSDCKYNITLKDIVLGSATGCVITTLSRVSCNLVQHFMIINKPDFTFLSVTSLNSLNLYELQGWSSSRNLRLMGDNSYKVKVREGVQDPTGRIQQNTTAERNR